MNIRSFIWGALPVLALACGGLDEDVLAPPSDTRSTADGVQPGPEDAGVPEGDARATDTASVDGAEVADVGGPPASPCTFPRVELQTGKDPQCSGGNVHFWPVGMAPSDCHGWSAVDTSGQTHENSADGIGCNPDGTFTFTQYAGNLNCEGSGQTKTYTEGVCQQDIPPVLYTRAVNLKCCTEPGHADCEVGVPSVSVPGGVVFLNGVVCD